MALRDPEALSSRTMWRQFCRHAQMSVFPSSSPPGWRCAAPLKQSQQSKAPYGIVFSISLFFSTNIVISVIPSHGWGCLGWQHGRGHGDVSDEEQTVQGMAMSGTGLLGGQRKTDIFPVSVQVLGLPTGPWALCCAEGQQFTASYLWPPELNLQLHCGCPLGTMDSPPAPSCHSCS